MELLKKGKTKDVYRLPDGNFLLKFKDSVTGGEDGGKDPGGNLVVGEVAGVGSAALHMTTYYFELLKKAGIRTHYVATDLKEKEMIVRPVTMFGNGLEFVVRYTASGSFVRRYGMYVQEGAKLNAVYEITLKDDARNDPPVTAENAVALGLFTHKQAVEIEKLVKKVCAIVKHDLEKRGLDLIDIKIEVGIIDGKVAVSDDISAGSMRVYKDKKQLDYLELSDFFK
ncbi:MAG: phosphoribosylaminoimidazolesuccinocarboxamide synthase [Firmicutes bacterium]|nr:phosphoribosylaminoimidazolesuccinocarboxamide synthase [Bacillota bacterium]